MTITGKAILRSTKGGSGSGNYGHSGRPGKLGGSIPKGAGGGARAAGAITPSLDDKAKSYVNSLVRGKSNAEAINILENQIASRQQQVTESLVRSQTAKVRQDEAVVHQSWEGDAQNAQRIIDQSKLKLDQIKATPLSAPPASQFLNAPEKVPTRITNNANRVGLHQVRVDKTPADIMASVAGTGTHLAYNNQKIGTTSRANQLMKGGAGLITVHDNKTRKEVGRWLLNRETGKWNYTPSKNQ